MDILTVVATAALVVLVVARRARPKPISEEGWRKPLVISAVGIVLLHDVALTGPAVAFLALTAVAALGSGALRGACVRVRRTSEGLVSSWGPAAFGAFALFVALRVGVDALAGGAFGVSGSLIGQSVLFSLGMSLAAEAVVVALRTRGRGATGAGAPVAAAQRV